MIFNYFKFSIKCSIIIAKNKSPKEFGKGCSKFPCNALFVIHLYDYKNDSLILVPHKLPNNSNVLIDEGINFSPFWEGSNPFAFNEIMKTIKLIISFGKGF